MNTEMLKGMALHLADSVAILYGSILVMLGVMGYLLSEVGGAAARRRLGVWWRVGVLAILLVVCGVVAKHTNLDFSRAEVVAKRAGINESSGQIDASLVLRSESLRLQPWQRQYRQDLAYALVEKVGKVSDLQVRRGLLEEAQPYLLGLWQENEAASGDAWDLARVYRLRAPLASDPSEQASLRAEAERYYRAASELFPANAYVLNEWASFYLDQGDTKKALERLEQSLRIDDRISETYIFRGSVYAEEGSYALALRDFERALVLKPESIPAREGRAALLKQMQQSKRISNDVR